jgi:hypothetical protein
MASKHELIGHGRQGRSGSLELELLEVKARRAFGEVEHLDADDLILFVEIRHIFCEDQSTNGEVETANRETRG